MFMTSSRHCHVGGCFAASAVSTEDQIRILKNFYGFQESWESLYSQRVQIFLQLFRATIVITEQVPPQTHHYHNKLCHCRLTQLRCI